MCFALKLPILNGLLWNQPPQDSIRSSVWQAYAGFSVPTPACISWLYKTMTISAGKPMNLWPNHQQYSSSSYSSNTGNFILHHNPGPIESSCCPWTPMQPPPLPLMQSSISAIWTTTASNTTKGTSIKAMTPVDGMSLIRESLQDWCISELKESTQPWREGSRNSAKFIYRSGLHSAVDRVSISFNHLYQRSLFDRGLDYSGLNTAHCALPSVIHFDRNKTGLSPVN